MCKIYVRAIALGVLMMMFVTTTGLAIGFPDVTEKDWSWAKSTIEEMSGKGYIVGFEDNTFRPAASVTKLQALILTARILGVNDPLKANYVKLAVQTYAKDLITYDNVLRYQNEVAYLLYNGILSTNELEGYIGMGNFNKPMKRYEAAVLFTKALGKEDSAKQKGMIVLPFKDAKDIPNGAAAYVQVVLDDKIMNGVSADQFSPNTEVNRAQIATMLSRVAAKLLEKEEIFEATITQVDDATATISVITAKNTDLKPLTYTVPTGALLRLDGKASTLKQFEVDGKVLLTIRNGVIILIEGVKPEVHETLSGIIKDSFDVTSSKKIRFIKDNSTTEKEYILSTGCVIERGGEKASFLAIQTGDVATITTVGGLVVKIIATSKNKFVSGVVDDIISTPDFILKVKLDDSNVVALTLSSSYTVYKNGKLTDIKALDIGDKVTANTEYDKISRLELTSTATSANGIIDEILISKNPTVTIRTGDKLKTFPIKRGAQYVIEGKDVQLYDLRLGQQVELTLDSASVTKVLASNTVLSVQVTGTVESVNTDFGFINIDTMATADVNAMKQQIFFKKGANFIRSKDNKTITVNDIKVGDMITAVGGMTSGVFEATNILVITP
ncbi:MAG: S-layer homology domain-containing protein [Hyphomonadaceae bacterium]|nr:S-layer homology domain-containing protein [Clostridia bacterium]